MSTNPRFFNRQDLSASSTSIETSFKLNSKEKSFLFRLFLSESQGYLERLKKTCEDHSLEPNPQNLRKLAIETIKAIEANPPEGFRRMILEYRANEEGKQVTPMSPSPAPTSST